MAEEAEQESEEVEKTEEELQLEAAGHCRNMSIHTAIMVPYS